MTVPSTYSFGDFMLQAPDDSTPPVYSTICGFTDRSLKITATAEETQVPDCDNEDAPTWPARDISALSGSITGQGVTTTKNAPFFRVWMLSGGKRVLRMGPMGRNLADDGGYWQATFVISSWEEAASKGKRVTANTQMDTDGPMIWVPATP